MIQLQNKDFITGNELNDFELSSLLELASKLKEGRESGLGADLLKGKSLALLFDKPSLRTRMSFFIAMQELGGAVIESVGSTRKKEEPQDTARVLSGYCHAVMVRTFDESLIVKMADYASIPVINGLSDQFHPCQTLADLLTIKEEFGKLNGIKVAYIGDGNNTLQSFLPIVEKTGIELSYSCPEGYGPNTSILSQFESDKVKKFSTPKDAVKGADVVYTDVWASMGAESEQEERIQAFQGFQVDRELLTASGKNAKVMHCLPMVRGLEIADELPDSDDSLIFKQSENRLHVQKALLVGLLNKKASASDGKIVGEIQGQICC